jgi:hypothetical protein
MAWVGQCRTAFESTVKALMLKQKKKRALPILKQIQVESEIPLRTLRRWWSEAESAENGTNAKVGEITNDCKMKGLAHNGPLRPICPICGKHPCRLGAKTGGHQAYRPYCKNCYNKKSGDSKKYKVLCPNCRQYHFVGKGDLIETLSNGGEL